MSWVKECSDYFLKYKQPHFFSLISMITRTHRLLIDITEGCNISHCFSITTFRSECYWNLNRYECIYLNDMFIFHFCNIWMWVGKLFVFINSRYLNSRFFTIMSLKVLYILWSLNRYIFTMLSSIVVFICKKNL